MKRSSIAAAWANKKPFAHPTSHAKPVGWAPLLCPRVPLLCIAAALACSDVCAATLVFADQAKINGDRIRLSDIASIEDAGEWTARLKELDLGKAPDVSRIERLKAKQVVNWVQRRFPQLQPIQWRGAESLLVQSTAHVISAALVSEKARAVLNGFSESEGAWRLQTGQLLRDLAVRDVPYEIEISVIRTTKQCERALVRVDVMGDAHVLGSVSMWFHNDRAVKKLPPFQGEGWGGDGVEGIVPQLAKAHPPPNLALEGGGENGETACKYVERLAGNRIKSPGKEDTLDVTRMQPVTVEIQGPALSIQTTGVALGNGKIGDMIRVRREAGTSAFSASVTGRGQVRIAAGDQL